MPQLKVNQLASATLVTEDELENLQSEEEGEEEAGPAAGASPGHHRPILTSCVLLATIPGTDLQWPPARGHPDSKSSPTPHLEPRTFRGQMRLLFNQEERVLDPETSTELML